MKKIIAEIEFSFAVEHMTMTEIEPERIRSDYGRNEK